MQHNSGKRVVIKIGTGSLVTDGHLEEAKVDRLRESVARGVDAGLSPVLVTSGAIAVGRVRHGGLAGPGLVTQQVAAAMGQGELYGTIAARFADRGMATGQLLLTPNDLIGPREETGRLGQTLDAMRSLGVIPVVNENDALGVRNNDVLAALISAYLRADLLLLLTNVDGFYDGGARHVTSVPRLTPRLEAAAGDSAGSGGTGGMLAKLCACWIATYAGVPAVIAGTTDPDVLVAAALGEAVGTTFHRRPVSGTAPDLGRLWRAFHAPPAGTIVCTQDGLTAVAIGSPVRYCQIKAIEGTFSSGAVINLTSADDANPVARGRIRYDSSRINGGLPPDATLFDSPDYVKIMEDQPCP